MSQNWRHYLDEEYEDEFEKTERIPHRPKNYDEKKPKKKDAPPPKPSKK